MYIILEAILFSLIPVFAMAVCLVRWIRWDIVDLYIIMIGFYFGLYPLLDEVISHSYISILTLMLSVSLVFSPVFMIWVIKEFLQKKIGQTACFQYLNLMKMADYLRQVNGWGIFLLTIFLLVFEVYGIVVYKIICNEDLSIAAQKDVSYWFSSLHSIYTILILSAFLPSIVKFFTIGKKKYLYMIILFILLFLSWLYGRREFFSLLFIALIYYFLLKKIPFFSKKTLYSIVTFIILFLLCSTLFQASRSFLISFQTFQNSRLRPVTLSLLVTNVRDRPNAWRLNNTIINADISKQPHVLHRIAFLRQAIKNTIPLFLWENKIVIPTSPMLWVTYHLPPMDYGGSLYSFVLADFGPFYGIIVLFCLLGIFFIIFPFALYVYRDHPFFFAINVGFLLHYIFIIEGTYDGLFVTLRNLFFIYILFWIYRFIRYINQ